jgi:hypothetical protein
MEIKEQIYDKIERLSLKDLISCNAMLDDKNFESLREEHDILSSNDFLYQVKIGFYEPFVEKYRVLYTDTKAIAIEEKVLESHVKRDTVDEILNDCYEYRKGIFEGSVKEYLLTKCNFKETYQEALDDLVKHLEKKIQTQREEMERSIKLLENIK